MPRKLLLRVSCLCLFPLLLTLPAFGIGEKEDDDASTNIATPPGAARIINDEGGPVVITGELHYTNAFFTSGVDDPLIILEDQAGFIDRNRRFILPLESQLPAQITSDFLISPFSYSLSLPLQPKGSLRDVDNDGEERHRHHGLHCRVLDEHIWRSIAGRLRSAWRWLVNRLRLHPRQL